MTAGCSSLDAVLFVVEQPVISAVAAAHDKNHSVRFFIFASFLSVLLKKLHFG
jgi:hypothetical protein